MRKFLLLVCATTFILSCNDKNDTENAVAGASENTSSEKIEYAYMPEGHPPVYWVPGDQHNVAMALNAVKGWETGNIEMALAPFADSIKWAADGYDERISKDTLRAWLTDFWKNTSEIKVTMNDYESVISNDKKEQWVTLWYKQVVTDKAGKKDSASVVDDMKFENGKIIVMDEKQRKYPASKK